MLEESDVETVCYVPAVPFLYFVTFLKMFSSMYIFLYW